MELTMNGPQGVTLRWRLGVVGDAGAGEPIAVELLLSSGLELLGVRIVGGRFRGLGDEFAGSDHSALSATADESELVLSLRNTQPEISDFVEGSAWVDSVRRVIGLEISIPVIEPPISIARVLAASSGTGSSSSDR